ncbi:MAG: glycosyltransferase [Pirellulaceae bacterium]
MDAARSIFPTSARLLRSDAARHKPPASVSLILPAYNEQEVIEQAIVEADEALAEIADDYEILIVDDGSRDATRTVALRAAEHRPAVRVISHATNRGYGAALRTGFQAATKDYVGFSDADCQFNLREINRLTLLLADCDVACGYRMDRQDAWHRIVYSKVYNALVRLLLGTGVRDCDCALKMFRRETLAELPITTDGFLVNGELLARARMDGKSVVEVGVTHRPRPRGQSTVSLLHILPVFIALMRFWWSIVLFPSQTSASPAATSGPVTAAVWGPMGTCGTTVLLGLLAGLLLLGNLAYPFIEPDESRYAQVALEMLQSGDFVVPRLLGEPYLDKPPLLYWVTAASLRALGPHEFGARFSSAFAGILTVLVTFVLGTRLFGSRPALLASLMLLLSLGFVLAGRFLIMDGLLTLFTTVCLLASILAVRGPQVRLAWWLLAAVACSLGILTKGPVAVVLTLPPLLSLLWLDRRHARVRSWHWLVAGAVILAITAPWFVLIAQRQGDFANHFLWKHHILRFVSAFNHQAPIWYYLPVLFLGMFPSSLLFGPTLGFLFSRRDHLRRLRTTELGAVALAAGWILIFFSASSCKLPPYILPAVPLLCLAQGYMLHHLLSGTFTQSGWARFAHRLPIHATDMAVATGASIAMLDLWLEPDRGLGQTFNCSVIGASLFFLIYRVLHRRTWPARAMNWVAVVGTSLLIMGFAFQKFVPEFALYRSINANAARIRNTADGHHLPVVYFEWECEGSEFYLPSDQIRFFEEDDLAGIRQFVAAHPQAVLVADPHQIVRLQKTLGRHATFTRSRGARGRLYLLSTRPLAHAVVGARDVTPLQR